MDVTLCRIVKDERFERLPCLHAGTYADDCLVQRVNQVTYLSHFKLQNRHFIGFVGWLITQVGSGRSLTTDFLPVIDGMIDNDR